MLMMVIQMMIRMMGMPIVTVPNGGHSDSLVIHQPALTVPLSGLVIIFNIWQKWTNRRKSTIFNIWQQFQLKVAKYTLRIPLRPAHNIQDLAKIFF